MKNEDIEEGLKYLQAKKNVEKIKGFYIHLVVFVFSMPIIIITNLMFVPGFHFFWLSLFGWGLGLFFHWFAVFGFKSSLFGKNWEDKKIKEFMEKDKRDLWE